MFKSSDELGGGDLSQVYLRVFNGRLDSLVGFVLPFERKKKHMCRHDIAVMSNGINFFVSLTTTADLNFIVNVICFMESQ